MSGKSAFFIFGGTSSKSILEGDVGSPASFWNTVRSSVGGNNLDYKIFDFIQSVDKLKNLPEDHDYYIQPDVASIATKLVAYLSSSYGIDSPKLLPENDECVSLEWENGPITKNLAVYKDAIDIMLYNKFLKLSCKDYLCDDGNFDFDHVGKTLSKSGKAKSTTAA